MSLEQVIAQVRKDPYFTQLCENYRQVDLRQLARDDTQQRMYNDASVKPTSLAALLIYLLLERSVPVAIVISPIIEEQRSRELTKYLKTLRERHPFIPSPRQPFLPAVPPKTPASANPTLAARFISGV